MVRPETRRSSSTVETPKRVRGEPSGCTHLLQRPGNKSLKSKMKVQERKVRSLENKVCSQGIGSTTPTRPDTHSRGSISRRNFPSVSLGLHPDTCPSISNTIKSLFCKVLILQKPQKRIQETGLDLFPHCSRCDLAGCNRHN